MGSKSDKKKSQSKADVDVDGLFGERALPNNPAIIADRKREAFENQIAKLVNGEETRASYMKIYDLAVHGKAEEFINQVTQHHYILHKDVFIAAAEKGREAQINEADLFAESLIPYFKEAKAKGIKSLRAKAAFFNNAGLRTRKGEEFGPVTIKRYEAYIARQDITI